MQNIKSGFFSCVCASALSLIMLAPSCLEAKEVVLDEKDNGKRVSLDINDTLRINLQGNRTTGFDWMVMSQPEGIKLIISQYVPIRPVMPGSPGICVFEFRAEAVCSSELKFQYARKWEKNVPPLQEFQVFVQVEEAKE